MPKSIKGVLFDKDGTLIDFEASWRDLVEQIIAEYSKGDGDLALQIGDVIGFDGRTRVFLPGSPVVADTVDVIASVMAQVLPGVSAFELEDDINIRATAISETGLAPVAGLAQALTRLRDMGMSLGIATHDVESAAHAHMRLLGVHEAFSFIAGYDSGHGHKPGPGMPNAFAAHIGADPSELVMVGDSIHDLGAGRSAGCAYCVAVLTGPATEVELAPYADIVLPSVADLPDFLTAEASR
jgi:phosphoglycolate phosphatase